MGKRANFTVERVQGFKCQPGKQQSIYWDGKTPGLGLRVTANDAKSYIFETRLHGKTLRLTIGDVKIWPIDGPAGNDKTARAEARRLKTLADQGIDPRQEAAQQQAKAQAADAEAKRQLATVAQVWHRYIEVRRHKWSSLHLADHIAIAQAGGERTQKGNRRTEPGPLAALMPLKLAEINSACVKAWLRDEAARRPTRAALAYRLLRAFLNWCSDMPEYRGIADADGCQTRLARDVLPKKNAKTDCLQREQLPAWFAAVRTIGNPIIAAYLQTLLLSGARREEWAALKWDDIDFRWRSVTIRDKVEGERTIPLTPYVSSLLAALPRRNSWVFSSPMAESGRLQEPSIQHRKVCAVAGIDGLTLHGLRRSFSSLTEWVECPAGVVAQIMGHKPSATAEKHYKVRPLDLLRMWHTKIETWILEQAGIKFEHAEQPGLRSVK